LEKLLKLFFAASGMALLLFAAAWGVSKWVGASRAEREALAVMSEPVRFVGHNAYPAIWLVDHPVPAAQVDAVMAEDVRRFAATPLPDGTVSSSPAFTTSAAQRYPSDAPIQSVRRLLCYSGEDCLTKVRGDLPRYRELVDGHADWFARTASATAGDHLHNPFPVRLDMPLPRFISVYAPATALALRFAQGEREAAIAGTCRRIVEWRRMASRSDLLVGWAIAEANAGIGYGQLLARMLSEVPNGQPLPESCDMAMETPAPAEVSMCAAMRSEFQFISAGSASTMDKRLKEGGTTGKPFYDAGMTRAAHALPEARFCTAETDAAFAADRPQPPYRSPARLRLQCVSNAIGCILADVAGSDHEGFAARHRDYLAAIRALGALAWWRNQPDALQDPVAVLKRLPVRYRATAHPLSYDAKRAVLTMPMLQEKLDVLTMPLPGSHVEQVAAH